MTTNKALISRIRENNKSHLPADAEVGVLGCVMKATVYEGSRELVGMMTTDDLDLDKEVVLPSGLVTTYLLRNKQIFLDHKYDYSHNVGVLRSIAARPDIANIKGFLLRFHVYNKENQFCNDILMAAKEAGQIGLSIGFSVLEKSRPTKEEIEQYSRIGEPPELVIRKAKLLEVSVTALPCNVSCQAQIASESKGAEAYRKSLGELVSKGAIKQETVNAMGLAINQVEGKAAERRVLPNGKRIVFL